MYFQGQHKIVNLYDSHVHWMYTGQVHSTWQIRDLNPQQILDETPRYRGSWVYGFGWDESRWESGLKPHRKFLDQKWPETPVFLSRVDGHSSWLNTAALKALNLLARFPESQDINLDAEGWPTGILKERAHIQALMKLPAYSDDQNYEHLKVGVKIFNEAGFGYIRDMTSSLYQWNLQKKLILDLDPCLHVEHWFVLENLNELEDRIREALACRSEENQMMKMRGIKIFVDGSLGSHTALLSQNYEGTNTSGQMNWSEVEIEEALQKIWSRGLEVALHCLGDEAVDRVIRIARKVYSKGIQGLMHLEHVEILRPETRPLLKSLHVRCHLQPCHWQSDRTWLKDKLPNLWKWSFPWAALEKNKIPFSFGSDSPIEKSSLISNLRSIQSAKDEGIPAVESDPLQYHQYPHQDGPTILTTIEDDQVVSVKRV